MHSLVPRPFRSWREKGLVSTVCACVSFSHFSGKQDSSTVYCRDTKKLKLPDVYLKEELRAAIKAVYEGMSLSVCLLAT